MIPISSNGDDYTYYLTTEAKGKVAAASVVVYGPGLDGVQVASDFFDFIERAVSKGAQALRTPATFDRFGTQSRHPGLWAGSGTVETLSQLTAIHSMD